LSREVEANTRLIKLHLQWPDRRKHQGSDEEALEFFKYLFLNFHMDRDVLAFESVDEIETFLEKNQRLLNAKPSVKKTKSSNARIEPRIANDASVVIVVDGEAGTELLGATAIGRTLDVGLHGLQVSLDDHDQNLAKGSQATLTLTTPAGDQYHLQVETKWSRQAEGSQLLGLRILETDGFSDWRSDFGAKFVSPKLARRNKPANQNSAS
jgi:hypothetical protein